MNHYKTTALSKKEKWKELRNKAGVSNKGLDEVFESLIDFGLFDIQSIARLDEMEVYDEHLISAKAIGTKIFHAGQRVINYESDYSSILHPVDFAVYFKEKIEPALHAIAIEDISISSQAKNKNPDTWLYQLSIHSRVPDYHLETNSTTDYLHELYRSLNRILVKMEAKQRFMDVDVTAKALFDPIKLKDIGRRLSIRVAD